MWRQDQLPPIERLLDVQNGLIHDVGVRLIEAGFARPGERVELPAEPPRFLPAGGDEPEWSSQETAAGLETDPRKIAAFFARA